MRRLAVAVLVLSSAACSSSGAATSRTSTVYACVRPDGRVAPVVAYTPPCPHGEVISWQVKSG